jgi:hypothetical protein
MLRQLFNSLEGLRKYIQEIEPDWVEDDPLLVWLEEAGSHIESAFCRYQGDYMKRQAHRSHYCSGSKKLETSQNTASQCFDHFEGIILRDVHDSELDWLVDEARINSVSI